MPRPLLFVPCDRVIFGIGDQSASLIIIIGDLHLYSGTIPGTITTFSRFSVFTQWFESSPSDTEGKIFEQRVAMAYKNEKPVFENSVEFRMKARIHRVVVNVAPFPALKAGECELTLSLREKGESEWPKPVVSYPMNVTITPQSPPNAEKSGNEASVKSEAIKGN